MTSSEFLFDLDRAPQDDVWAFADTTDDDGNWARREFEGLTGRQAWALFEDNILGAAESIGSMPDEAFKYYTATLALYVDQLDFGAAENAAAAADCLFGYLEARKESSPSAVEAVLRLAAPVLLKLAANQGANDMPMDIYGDLSSRARALLDTRASS
jgi:hypothetical protein